MFLPKDDELVLTIDSKVDHDGMGIGIWEVAEVHEHLCYGLPSFSLGLVDLTLLSIAGVLRILSSESWSMSSWSLCSSDSLSEV